MAICDTHLDSKEPVTEAYKVAKQFCRDVRPDVLVVCGDFLDFSYLSKFTKDSPLLVEGRRYQKDIDMAVEELEEWRNYCLQMEFLPGNHEERLTRYIERLPLLEGKMDLRTDLQLHGMGIGWTEYNAVLSLGKLNFTHGWYYNKYHAMKHLNDMGDHLFYGHVHDHQVVIKPVRAKRESHIAMSMGCLCSKNPAWKRNRPNEWINGIGFFEVSSSGNFTPLFIPIIDGELSYGGFTWRA
jgi:predicted phosphodiesterase